MSLADSRGQREYEKFGGDVSGSTYVLTMPGKANSIVLTGSQMIVSGAGTLYGAFVSVSAVSGSTVDFIDSNTISGSYIVSLGPAGTNQVWDFQPSVGVKFSNGIFYRQTNSGSIVTTVVYRG